MPRGTREPAVQSGLDNLSGWAGLLRGKKIGLLTGDAAVNATVQSSVDVLHELFGLTALFAAEHGVRSELQAGDQVDFGHDRLTGLPVYSLYSDNSLYSDKKAPSAAELQAIDVFVIDLQDVGARFYTYLYSIAYVMEACAAAHVPVVLLDRPNPLGGLRVEGPVLDPACSSFVGRFAVPVRYGLTIGEFARLINETESIHCQLTVVPLAGWQRKYYFSATGLPWVAPSPNIPTADCALIYIGTCLFEGTNLSEGRGTTRPFQLIGAPWLEATRVIKATDRDATGGCLLRPCWFRPMFSKHAQVACAGVQLHVTDRDRFCPFAAGVALLDAIRQTHADFMFLEPDVPETPWFIDKLSGNSRLRQADFDLQRYLSQARADAAAFSERSRSFWLYR